METSRKAVRPSRRTKIARRGFTYMELGMVMTVLAVLASVVAVVVSGSFDTAHRHATSATMREVQQIILNRYRIEMAGKVTNTHPDGFLVPLGFPGPDTSELTPSTRGRGPQLVFLFVPPNSTSTFDPIYGRGWRGPYFVNITGRYPNPGELYDEETAFVRGFTSAYGIGNSTLTAVDGDPTVVDAWGSPLVIQGTTELNARLISAGPDRCLVATPRHPDGELDNIELPLR